MNLASITPLILTFNEAANLTRTLEAVSWANRIVVLDSGSTDATEKIASQFPQVVFVTRPFDNHTAQWNYGLSLVESEWVLTLDADYVCAESLATELQDITSGTAVFFARFEYCVNGSRLGATLYPPRAVLFRPAEYQYVPDGHTQTLDLRNATMDFLKTPILHDDRKPLFHWFSAQVKYALLEADKLSSSDADNIGWKDRLRKRILFAPPLTLVYCLFAKRLILDGWRGVFYSLQRTFAELVLSLVLLDRKLRGEK